MTSYLDNNATTPVLPTIAARMAEVLALGPLNPDSPHAAGRLAKTLLEAAEARILGVFGLDASHRVVFTSGATEALNLAIKGLRGAGCARVVTLSIDHPALMECASRANGHQVLAVSRDGGVDWSVLEGLGAGDVLAMHSANNETGQLFDPHVAHAARERGALLVIDASQSPAKQEGFFELMQRTAPDVVVISGHKMHAPVGSGAMLIRRGTAIEPQLHGGSQGHGMRGGTAAVMLADALSHALEQCRTINFAAMRACRDRLVAALAPLGAVLTLPPQVARLDNTVHYRLVGVEAQRQVLALDLAGVQCSSTSACASGSLLPSHTLSGMGFGEQESREGVRLCVSHLTTAEELDHAEAAIASVLGRMASAR